MSEVVEIALHDWDGVGLSHAERDEALRALEAGKVVFFPALAFPLAGTADLLASPSAPGRSKNVSFDAGTGVLRAGAVNPRAGEEMKRMMGDYARRSTHLLHHLFPRYAGLCRVGRTSFRPVEISTRKTSWRKDDTRLHVDSFPSTPVCGERILRVFTNVNRDGQARVWRTGEDFERVASRFLPRIRAPFPGSSAALRWLHITKKRRTPYDHYMLHLHDAMKRDEHYQLSVPQREFRFPAGSSWLVYTDVVSHAAMAGRCALEQTFYLPVKAMAEEQRSPLRILERLLNRPLI